MRTSQLEAKVLTIIDQAKARSTVEDDHVELKSIWPSDAQKAARRLAGHANAARGEPLIWIVGVDEGNFSVCGASHNELSSWYPQIVSEFEGGIAPDLISHPNMSVEGKNITALLFDTDRAPYVVKTKGAGAAQFEVPWRQGNSTRTARREDLLRILAPAVNLPECDVLSGVAGEGSVSGMRNFGATISLHITAHPGQTVVIRRHRCSSYFSVPGEDARVPLQVDRIQVPGGRTETTETSGETTIARASTVTVSLQLATAISATPNQSIDIGLSLDVAFAGKPIEMRLRFAPKKAEIGKLPSWEYVPS